MKIEKKDLVYWIVILVLVIVTILTVKLGNNNSAIDHFGFAGTIIGIVLAVVALIYSFYQSSVYGNTTTLLDDSAKKIQEVTKDLEKVKDIEKISEKLEHSLTTMNQISASLETYESALEFRFNNIDESISEVRFDIITRLDGSNSMPDFEIEEANEEGFFQSLINALPHYQFVLLYVWSVSYKNRLHVNTSKLIEHNLSKGIGLHADLWSTEDESLKETIINRNFGAATATLWQFQSWLQVDGTVNHVIAQEFNHTLLRVIEEHSQNPFIHQELPELSIFLDLEKNS